MGRTIRTFARGLAAVALLGVGGCASSRERAAAQGEWRVVATDADRTRIRTWRDGFTKALAQARRAGHADEIEAQGPLLRPDAALDGPAPPPGDYRCRVVRLGATGNGGQDFVATAADRCRIAEEGGRLTIARLGGSQRPAGQLYADGEMRMIFLGTMRMADETRALDYGRDRGRDMAGIVERIGPRRWRLVLPWPQWQSTLEVVELAPAG